MNSLRNALAALGLLVAAFAGQASAAPIFFNFHVDFTGGPLNHQTFFGNFSVDGNDCPGNVCTGNFTPANAAHTLLSFNITVAGSPFNLADDGFTTVGLSSNLFTFVDYFGVNAAGNTLQILGNPTNPGAAAAFITAAGVTSPGIARVPEPGTLALLGGALVAALAFRARRKVADGHAV